MTDKEFLAFLKAELFRRHGTDELKCRYKVGENDRFAGGGAPYCKGVRAIDETAFEWYLDWWAYGWYREDESIGLELTDKQKIRILCGILKVPRIHENNASVVESVESYASRYGLEALGYAILDMVRSGHIAFSQKNASKVSEYNGKIGQ